MSEKGRRYLVHSKPLFSDSEGTVIGSSVRVRGGEDEVDSEEARGAVAAAWGQDPEDVHFKSEIGNIQDIPTRRKLSLAFSASKWNSSWDPKAEKGDPSLN